MMKLYRQNHAIKFIFGLCAIILTLTACSTINNKRAENHYKQGLEYYFIERDLEKAIAEFDQAIELNPAYADAFYYRGQSYVILNEYDHAIADFSRTIEIDPNYAAAYEGRGDAYIWNLEDSLLDAAIEDYSTAIQLNPESAYAYGQRAYIHLTNGQPELALPDLDRAIALEEDPVIVARDLFSRSRIYKEMGEYEKAMADLDQAAEVDPGFGNTITVADERQELLALMQAE